MFAVQNRHVALRIIFSIDFGHLLWRGFRFGQRSPLPVANPSPLHSSRSINIEEAHRVAILLQLIFHVAFESQRLRVRKVDAGVIKILAIVDAHRNKPGGLGMCLIAGPLKDCDSAQNWSVSFRFSDLARILRMRSQNENERSGGDQPSCLYPQST
jgi:hypothetical protein